MAVCVKRATEARFHHVVFNKLVQTTPNFILFVLLCSE